MKFLSVTIQMKATELYFPVVLLATSSLSKFVSSLHQLSLCGAVYYAVQDGSKF